MQDYNFNNPINQFDPAAENIPVFESQNDGTNLNPDRITQIFNINLNGTFNITNNYLSSNYAPESGSPLSQHNYTYPAQYGPALPSQLNPTYQPPSNNHRAGDLSLENMSDDFLYGAQAGYSNTEENSRYFSQKNQGSPIYISDDEEVFEEADHIPFDEHGFQPQDQNVAMQQHDLASMPKRLGSDQASAPANKQKNGPRKAQASTKQTSQIANKSFENRLLPYQRSKPFNRRRITLTNSCPDPSPSQVKPAELGAKVELKARLHDISKLSSQVQKTFRELSSWMETYEKELLNEPIQDYLHYSLANLNEGQMNDLFKALCREGLVTKITNTFYFFDFKIDYDGHVDDVSFNRFKRLHIVIYFLKFYKSHPNEILQAVNRGDEWVKELFLLILTTEVGKVGLPLFFKSLHALKQDALAKPQHLYMRYLSSDYRKKFADREYSPMNDLTNFIGQYLEACYGTHEVSLLIPESNRLDTFYYGPSFDTINIMQFLEMYFSGRILDATYLQGPDKQEMNYNMMTLAPPLYDLHNFLYSPNRKNLSFGIQIIERHYSSIIEKLRPFLEARVYGANAAEDEKSVDLIKIFLGCFFCKWSKENNPIFEYIKNSRSTFNPAWFENEVGLSNPAAKKAFWNVYKAIFR